MTGFFVKRSTKHVSVATRGERRGMIAPMLLLASFAIASISGCGGAIQYASDSSGGSASSGDTLSDLSDSTSDGAQDQCTLYDPTSATRSLCIGCYDSLVSSYCPGETAIGDCVDTEFQQEFPDRLNQCILNSTVAGFTCSITCDDSEDLDEASCTCVTRATQSTGLSSISLIDVGQFDSGPPVVTAYASSSLLTQTVPASDPCSFTGTTGSSIYLSIRNRGGTMFRDNTYSVASSYSNDDSNFVTPSFSAASAFASTYLGINGYLNFGITLDGSGGDSEDIITDDYSGEPGSLERLAGAPFAVTSPSPSPSPLPTNGPTDGGLLKDQEFNAPTALTRDALGNIFFANSVSDFSDAGGIFVICYDITTSTTTNPWCNGKTMGSVVKIAGGGTWDQSTNYWKNTGTGRFAANFQSISRLMVDYFGNIFFADTHLELSGTNTTNDSVIGIACSTANLGGFCTNQPLTAGAVYALAGRATNASDIYASALTAGTDWLDTSTEYLIDDFAIETDYTNINIYYSRRSLSTGTTVDGDGALRRLCGFDPIWQSACDGVTSGTADSLVSFTGTPSGALLLSPFGNLLIARPSLKKLQKYCLRNDSTDFCLNESTLSALVDFNAGTDNSDSPSDTAVTDATFLSPTRILPSYPYEVMDTILITIFALFPPSPNLVLISSYQKSDSDDSSGGNIARLICLPDTSGDLSDWCKNRSEFDTVVLAGIPGAVGTGASSATSATGVAFGNLNSATWDPYKNLVLSSSFQRENNEDPASRLVIHPGIPAFDNSIYRLRLQKETGSFGAKYVFTDSNAQSSYYCLSLKAQVSCGLTYFDSDDDGTEEYADACTCTLLPSSGNPQGYWMGSSSTASCN